MRWEAIRIEVGLSTVHYIIDAMGGRHKHYFQSENWGYHIEYMNTLLFIISFLVQKIMFVAKHTKLT